MVLYILCTLHYDCGTMHYIAYIVPMQVPYQHRATVCIKYIVEYAIWFTYTQHIKTTTLLGTEFYS